MANRALVWSLYYGKRRTPLAQVVPDEKWPGMWRVHMPDGRISDMVNLSRAKDAAAVAIDKGPPRRPRMRFRWRQEASVVRFPDRELSNIGPEPARTTAPMPAES